MKFKAGETATYKGNLYRIILDPSRVKTKDRVSGEWEKSYVYRPEDDPGGPIYVREKDDFESKFEAPEQED